MKKISVDNPFFQMMGRLGDIMIINALFLLCSLPVLTIGASLSAMYQTCFQLTEGTEGRLIVIFFRNFRECLKRSTAAWVPMMAAGLVLFFDMAFLGETDMSGAWKIVGVGTGCLLFLWELLSAWLYAVLAVEKRNLKEGLARSMELSVRCFPATIFMVLLNNIPLFCVMFGMYYVALAIPVYLFAGFGLTGYVSSFFLKKGFCFLRHDI